MFDIRNSLRKVPYPLDEYLRELYRKLLMANYRYTIWSKKQRVEGTSFKSYGFVDIYRENGDKLLQLLLEECEEGDVIYDIGANRGLYALSLLSAVPNSHVVAFEPNPRSFSCLTKNVELNNFEKRSNLNNIGLSDFDGTDELYLSRNSNISFSIDGGSSFNKYNASRESFRLIESLECDIRQLDTFLNHKNFSVPDKIKIDVEGSGLEVLKGAEKTLKQHKPDIYFEPHKNSYGSLRREEVESLVNSLGYEIREHGRYWIMKA